MRLRYRRLRTHQGLRDPRRLAPGNGAGRRSPAPLGEIAQALGLEVPGISPTNNDAEQAMRGPVILRRISGGTQSERGNRWIKRILSTIETCRRQHRSTHSYIVDAIDASLNGRPIPSLVPG